jgi:hypothetical protein
MQNPTSISALRDFEEWKTSCNVQGQPLCSLPNPCPVTTRDDKFTKSQRYFKKFQTHRPDRTVWQESVRQ